LGLFAVLWVGLRAAAQEPALAALEFQGEGQVAVLNPGVKLFTDRPYVLAECPALLKGQKFLVNSIEQADDWTVSAPGVLTVLTPVNLPKAATQIDALIKAGFQKVDEIPAFQFFGDGAINCVDVFQKAVQTGERFQFSKWVVAVGFSDAVRSTKPPRGEINEELLYNGITLESDPRDRSDMAAFGTAPLPVPYLENPPAVIPIGLGRQLFVDDFLIERTTLKRTWHKAQKDSRSPVLTPETPLELGGSDGHSSMAAPFSGGVWYDAQDELFKVWYCAGWFDGTAYAFSRDGLNWERPSLPVEPGTNRIIPRKGVRDSAAVILDPDAPPNGLRYKMLVWSRPQGGELFVSHDGISWSDPVAVAKTGDRSTIFYNPFRKVWVYSIRSGWHARSREYSESPGFLGGADLGNRVKWLRADELDLPSEHWFYAFPDREPDRKGDTPSLYNFDAVAYESLMLGAFTVMQGPANNFCSEEGVPKMTEIHMGFSRDGFHWSRPDDRTAFIPGARAAGTWDRAYLHSNAALCLIVGDELWFYYTGFAGDPALKNVKDPARNGMYANASMGIARLRRDGFASMDAGAAGGTLTTRPVVFSSGSRLFVNADTRGGELRVEVLDQQSNPIDGLTLAACLPVSEDSTIREIRWQDGANLQALCDQPVRFRFHVTNGSLYAFWVSDVSGASGGYLAGGGPGYASLKDEEGAAAR
jgi:hypothetical protein